MASISSTQRSADIPTDEIFDIFTRLPVKSLARFKCLSKFTNALLSNTKFARQHLQMRAILANPNLILKFESKLFSVDDDEWTKCRRLHLPFASSLDGVEVSGSCNGLLCISDQQRDEDIFLYNPSTGVHARLPFPDFDLPTIESSCFTTLGFGYHRTNDDYKVIRCVYLYDKPFVDIDSYTSEARIYSLNTGRWKKIRDVPFHLGYKAAIWLGNEFLVWKATRGMGRSAIFSVVSFDMEEEEFEEIPQPQVEEENRVHMEVGVLGGCLSMIYVCQDHEGVDVWLMKEYGVKESWTLQYVMRRPEMVDGHYMFLKPLIVLKNGEILVEAGEKGRVLYDPTNQTHSIITIHQAPRRFSLIPNVGSLVSPFP